MRRVLEIGSLVSFTGIVTFKNGQNVRDTVAATPLDKFMLETDCPYLAPVPYRGKRCEPAYVKEISEIVAQVKNCSLEELSAATCKTAHEFFRKLYRRSRRKEALTSRKSMIELVTSAATEGDASSAPRMIT